MKRLARKAAVLCTFALIATTGAAEEHVVAQKDKAFSVSELVVRVGDAVSFLNSDPFFHNIFSLSDSATFDLGSYPAGEARDFTFTEAGEVEIECAIHPRMKMKIKVVE